MILMSKIIIEKPKIENCESEVFGKAIRLVAEITMKNPNTNKIEKNECYFEFEKEYEKFICSERSDAFVMGLLTTAMENNMDIEFEMPISEKLYYQLTTYYIPMVSKYNADYPMHNIKLIGPLDNTPIVNEKAVATGCSGGVDSFYTIAKHLSKDVPNTNKLTHIVYSSSGTSDINDKRIKDEYKRNKPIILSIAKDCNLKAIFCFNNLYKFYKTPFRGFTMFYTTTFCSVAFALQKLISIYYASSGDPIKNFSLDLTKTHGHDSQVFDVYTLSCINNENLNFYSAGQEYSRIEKEQYISDFIPAQKNLRVCASMPYLKNPETKYKNCSMCPKCLRTMTQFYVINKLDCFKDVFNIEEFYKHKTKYIAKMIVSNKKSYVDDMKKFAKINKVKISFGSYLLAYLYKPFKLLKNILKKSLFVRKIYYKLNLDYKIYGYRDPKYESYKEKIK